MKIRSVSLNRTHIPVISFTDFDGVEHKNADLPESEQIRVEIKMASGTEMIEYQKGYSTVDKFGQQKFYNSMNINNVILKHVLKIHNLDHETGIIDTAEKLISGAKKDDILSVILLDCFNVIMGRSIATEPGKEPESENLTLGE